MGLYDLLCCCCKPFKYSYIQINPYPCDMGGDPSATFSYEASSLESSDKNTKKSKMEDVSLLGSLIACCLYGESEPQPSNEPRPKQGSTKDNDFEGLKNIFAPFDITDDVISVTSEVSRPRASSKCLKPSLGDMVGDPSAECKAFSSESLGQNTNKSPKP